MAATAITTTTTTAQEEKKRPREEEEDIPKLPKKMRGTVEETDEMISVRRMVEKMRKGGNRENDKLETYIELECEVIGMLSFGATVCQGMRHTHVFGDVRNIGDMSKYFLKHLTLWDVAFVLGATQMFPGMVPKLVYVECKVAGCKEKDGAWRRIAPNTAECLAQSAHPYKMYKLRNDRDFEDYVSMAVQHLLVHHMDQYMELRDRLLLGDHAWLHK